MGYTNMSSRFIFWHQRVTPKTSSSYRASSFSSFKVSNLANTIQKGGIKVGKLYLLWKPNK